MIGVGITTRNRPLLLAKCRAAIDLYYPPAARVVVVDDASAAPVDGADFRFEVNVGIAAAKNKCLELLSECEHLFLFDDDTYPVTNGWWAPYVDSPEPHLMYVFEDYAAGGKAYDTRVLFRDDALVAYDHPRGCMLYVRRDCLDRVGGMDPSFGLWGYEHPDFSDRIHAAGLTRFAYADVPGSAKLFHAADEHREVESSVSSTVRADHILRNEARYAAQKGAVRYVEYRT